MHPMLNIAVKAARRAGNLIHRAADNLDHLTVTKKSHADYVSEVDRAAERIIIESLLEAYPSHAILAEESGAQGQSEYVWIIDPLDGTTNFLHGVPQYAVSIGLQHNGVLTQAVIYDPTKNDLFTATRGRGAYLNDKRLRVSKRKEMADSLIGTGFPYSRFEHMDAYMAIFKDLMQKTAGLRRPGPPRWTWRGQPLAASTAFSRPASNPGISPPDACSSLKRAAWSATCTAPTLPAERPPLRGQPLSSALLRLSRRT